MSLAVEALILQIVTTTLSVFDHVVPIKRHLGYTFRYKSKLEKLKKEVRQLDAERESLQHSVDEQLGQGNEIHDNVVNWLSRVDPTIQVADLLIQAEDEEAKKRCFFGVCPNLKSRYLLGKRADEDASRIAKFKEEKSRFGPISHRPPLQQILTAPVPGYKAESREELLKRVMEKLQDPNVDRVGLYGMGGIGKTTLAEEVHKQATRVFDVVVMTTVTAQPELRKIQGEIADLLRLKFEQETEVGRASRLHEFLKEKRALLILDDLWGTLKLEKIGIPTATKNDSKGCKILLTSRILDVLSDMGSICNFKVEDLSKDEAISLFRKKVDVVEDPKIAEEILLRCHCFPLLIVTMAGLLRNKPLHTWRDSLTQLSRFDNQELEEKVYSVLKLSYDRLVSEETKLIFLLCGICPQSETTILDLLKYCWGLCLFRRYTLAEARDRLNKLIDDLKASSLLLDVDEEGFMKMHDTVREVAIQIACKHQGAFRVVDGEELKKWPFKDDLKNCTKISMPLCRIQELPEDLECPSVEFFLLFLKGGSLNVPDSAFQHTRKLIVLHFKGMKFSPVPNSLCSLTNLHTLCLDDCSFCDVSIIGQLKKLQILSFRGSDLQRLPDEIGQLTQLKLLDLSHCYQLEVIPANVLSKLSALEELLMRNSFDQWEAQDHHNRSNASLADLEYLSHLNTLEVKVHSAEALTGFSFSKKMERYHIEVRDRWYFHEQHESSKTIVVAVDTNIDILPAIQKLLKETETLILMRLNAGSNIFNSPENEGFPKLKNLFVDYVTDIKYITDYSKAVINGFPFLESLKLQNLASLVNICHGDLVSESFGKLRSLDVYNCKKLKYLFSMSMVRGLSQLEEIDVQKCENMEGIIVNESDNGNNGNEVVELPCFESFGKLRKLAVSKCNKLKYLFSISMVRGLSQLEEIEVRTCKNMEGIIVNESDIGYYKNEAVELPLLESFGKLRKVTVSMCDKLKYLFSITMVRGLSQLEEIDVRKCKKMEGIIVNESDNGYYENEAVELPLLESFGKLRKVAVSKCNKLKYLFSISMVRGLSQLEEIDVQECENMEGIIVNESDNGYYRNEAVELPLLESFGKLRKLAVSKCNKLKYLFSISMARGLSQLEEIDVQECENMEGIIVNESDNSYNGNEAVELHLLESFGKLRKVAVYKCNKLTYLFSTSMVRGLSQLEEIYVQECENMKEIIFNESDDGYYGNETVELPLLESFGKLRKLAVSKCNKLKYLFSISMIRGLSQLEEIDVQECKNMKGIIVNESDNGYNGNETVELPLLESFGKLRKVAVYKCNKLTYLFSISMVRGLSQLEEIYVQECENMEGIIFNESDNGYYGNEVVELPRLESFGKLRKLTVSKCNKLKYLFSISMVRGLSQLEEIEVRTCENMEVIIVNESDNSYYGNEAVELHLLESFGKLRKLTVSMCDKLKYLFSISMVRGLLQLEEIDVWMCENMEGIMVNESDNGYYGNEAVELPLLESFGKLRKVTVSMCDKLKYLFSISMVRGLSQLEEIDVRNCKKMEGIIVNESDNGYYGNEAVELPLLESFGKLRKLAVSKCNRLKYLFSISMVRGLSQLEEIDVQECENMEGIIVNESDNGYNRNDAVKLPLLESFGKLRKVAVFKCNKLKYLFSISMVRGLSQLEEIDVRNCKNIEGIIVNESDNCYYGNEVVELPRLRDLTLQYLPQLQGFTSKGLLSLFDETVVLPNLEKLAISDCDNFKMLWNNPLDTSSFGKLKKLLIKNCHNLLTVFPSNILERFHKLEELLIESCDSIGVIYHLQESSVNKTNDFIAGFQLRILRMISLRKLVYIWSVDLPGTISLKNLQCLVFPQLTELVLDNLPELVSFCTDHMLSREWPQLKLLQATGCEKAFRCTLEQFNAQNSYGKAQEFPNCEKMVLDGPFMGMMMQPSKFQLPSLKYLELRSRIGWWARYPESSIWLHIQRLPNLRELTLETLQLRELMLYPQEGQGGGDCLKALATHPIPKIRVTSNCGLIRIMNKTELEKFATNPYIERVEILSLKACLFLENVAPTLVSNFSSLTSLYIFDCNRLISLVTISVATSLVQLKHMYISHCCMLREILAFDDAAATNNAMQENIVFPKLETLICSNLPSLRGFYMGSHITLEFPSLKKVYSNGCPKMNVFSCGTLKTPKLKGELNSTIRELCLDYFRYIRTLKLDPSFLWLVEQWHCEQLPFQVFENLETLVVDNCSCFLFAVPWKLLLYSTTLKSLSIERCDALENVFDPKKLKNEDLRHVGSVALLEHLHLVDLPKVRNVWNKDPHGILDIRNLQVLKVHNCGNLTELFTLSMALDLVHLRDLEVKQCTFLQVVIEKEEDEQIASNSTLFPSLESLYLEYLPSLTSLCSGSYVLNFKGLCKVALVECPNMQICAFTPTTEEGDPRDMVEGNEEDSVEGNDEDSRNYICFLGCKVEISNIQELKVEWNNLNAMWTVNNQAEFLKSLEVLELLHFPEEDLNSVSDLLQKFSKLERLVLNSSFLKKIVLSSFNIKDENQGSSEQLKVLKLISLPCLNHLMVEDSEPIRDFKYPDGLEVSNYNILRILVLPSVYFETLTTLEVSKCHGLINLIAFSAARSMVHLKRMTVSECEMVTEIVASKEDGVTVSECEMVTEIVASEEDGAKAEICFRELEHLQLHCLPCLTSFCSGDLCFTFPSLKKVVVIECPKMNTFAPNILSAPLVRRVQITKDEDGARWIWEGSLNSTIEEMYMEMNS